MIVLEIKSIQNNLNILRFYTPYTNFLKVSRTLTIYRVIQENRNSINRTNKLRRVKSLLFHHKEVIMNQSNLNKMKR